MNDDKDDEKIITFMDFLITWVWLILLIIMLFSVLIYFGTPQPNQMTCTP